MFFIIYYLMGILGTVRMLWETFFQESDFAVFLNETVWISLLFVFCHWVIRRWKGSRWILFCLPAVLVLMGRGVFALTERIGGTAALSSGFEILYQSIHITSWNHFYPGDLMSRYVLRWDTSDYLAFGIVLAIFALLLYLAAVVKGSRMGVVFLLALPLAAVLAVGETPSLLAMSLVVFCCIGIFAGNRAYPLRALGATAAGLVLLGVSCVLVLPGSGQMEERKLETRQWVRETFTFTDFPAQSVITLPNFPGLSENPGELTNEDNIRYTGNQVAEVVTWNQPEETVYLRNYYGSEYTGHGWDARETEEEDAFAAAEYLEEIRGETIQQEMEISLYYPENGSYVPYFSDLSWQSEPAGLSPTTGYRYFPRERYLELMGQASQSEREDAWRSNDVSIREDEYLQWPEELRSLKQICDENPMEDIGEIRQFIVSWLAQNCSYNLQVGRFPEDEDPIEYFLFERKEGYCQHFASAAVMMFRMYGVPARYATGLAVQAHLFENNGAAWTAHPTDRSAHAWVEIYQPECGWIPVEVTPGGAVRDDAGTEAALQEELPVENQQTEPTAAATPTSEAMETSETPTPTATDTPEQTGEPGGVGENGAPSFLDSEAFQTILNVAKVLAAVLCVAGAVVLLLAARRGFLLAARRKKGVTGIFCDLLEVLQKGGLPSDTDWLADDFVQNVCRRFPWMEEESFQAAMDLVTETAYGEKRETKKERERMRKLYLRSCREICGQMGRMEAFRFRVWDGYF